MNLMKKFGLIATLVLLIVFVTSFIYAGDLPRWFPFKREDALKKWEEKIFKGRVIYTVKIGKTDGYLNAYSEGTASGMMYKLVFDPKEKPMASWSWRVIRFPDKKKDIDLNSNWVEQDDYAARFYVIFPKLSFTHTKAIEYVWDKDLPEGSIITNPLFDNIKIIVAESGWKNVGKWVQEERNIYEDCLRVFGRKPGKVGAIAVMTDTDNTASTAEANYDNIKVGYNYGDKE